jgi:hypothetical protein
MWALSETNPLQRSAWQRRRRAQYRALNVPLRNIFQRFWCCSSTTCRRRVSERRTTNSFKFLFSFSREWRVRFIRVSPSRLRGQRVGCLRSVLIPPPNRATCQVALFGITPPSYLLQTILIRRSILLSFGGYRIGYRKSRFARALSVVARGHDALCRESEMRSARTAMLSAPFLLPDALRNLGPTSRIAASADVVTRKSAS